MVKTKKKKNVIRRIIFNAKIFTLIALVLIVLISIPLIKKVNQKYRIDNEIKELEKEIAELENKNTNLKGFVDYLESDQFIQEQARLQFGLKKEGEETAVIKIEDHNENESILADNSNTKTNYLKNNNIQKWFNYFFN